MKRSGIKTALVCLALAICHCALAVMGRADVLLQGFYWDVAFAAGRAGECPLVVGQSGCAGSCPEKGGLYVYLAATRREEGERAVFCRL